MDRYDGLKLVSRDTDLNLLVKVIGKLSSGEKCHVNYRDSKLTHILQNSLGKASKSFSFIEPMFVSYFPLPFYAHDYVTRW